MLLFQKKKKKKKQTNKKKNHQIAQLVIEVPPFKYPKFWKMEKLAGLEIWWTATFAQNLALIYLMVSEKTCFMDRQRMDTGSHDISSAVTIKQRKKKKV